jgi:hypothetical protein
MPHIKAAAMEKNDLPTKVEETVLLSVDRMSQSIYCNPMIGEFPILNNAGDGI